MRILRTVAVATLYLTACGGGAVEGTPDANGPSDASTPDANRATDASAPDASAPDADIVSRGEYLVNNVAACGECHTPRDGAGDVIDSMFLAGNPTFVDTVPADDNIGLLPSKNLTNDPTGLMAQTDAQIKGLLLDGDDGAGVTLAPVMPYPFYHNMTSEDADAIVAYLRTVPGVFQTIPAKQMPWTSVPKASPVDVSSVQAATDASTTNGRYLATTVANCLGCHTEESAGPGSPPNLSLAFAGGHGFELAPGFTAESANLTVLNGPTVTAQEIVDEFTTGQAAGSAGTDLICPPMPVGATLLGGMTTSDKTDIANYILSLNDIANAVIECTPP